MNQLDTLRQWYASLQMRERVMVISTAIILVISLFYVAVWEPLHQGLDAAQQEYESNLKNLQWMQQAAAEVRTLKASGSKVRAAASGQPVPLVVEQVASNSAIKANLSKLESSSNDGARVVLDGASFDQMLIWLNTLEQNHGIPVSSANIERGEKPGTVNARLSFNKAE
jgi:general secretion pathway protein M